MHDHSVVINNIAPEGSNCEICGKSAKWQMYCKDCGHILRFYCDEHAYLSQGDPKLEKQVKIHDMKLSQKYEKELKKAQELWAKYLNCCGR